MWGISPECPPIAIGLGIMTEFRNKNYETVQIKLVLS